MTVIRKPIAKSVGKYSQRYADSSLSAAIVKQLQQEGMTLKEIGDMMGGLSHAFISQVKNGKKNFTMARLEKLEIALDRPLPMLLLQAVEKVPRPKELEKSYKNLRKKLSD